jgi:hypothetical protein
MIGPAIRSIAAVGRERDVGSQEILLEELDE